LIAGEVGNRHFGTRPFLADALRSTRKERPTALYLGAANGDDRAFGTALCVALTVAGAGKIVWPKIAQRRERTRAREALERTDFVFVGGGDVEAGMAALHEAELVADLHAAAARGAVLAGLSAGAIMLGERWIRWPHEAAGDDEAATYECLGLAPCVVDTHDEESDWQEARAFVRVRARELGCKTCVYGVPSGAALVASPGGKLVARGAPVSVFSARPRARVKLERSLPAEP
jgi:cyanophycinase-like exopeptidase